MPNRRHVGRMTADKGNGIFDTDKLGNRALEYSMDRSLTRDQPTCGDAGSIFIDSVFCRLLNLGMPRQSNIVITREIDVGLTPDTCRFSRHTVVRCEKRIRESE